MVAQPPDAFKRKFGDIELADEFTELSPPGLVYKIAAGPSKCALLAITVT